MLANALHAVAGKALKRGRFAGVGPEARRATVQAGTWIKEWSPMEQGIEPVEITGEEMGRLVVYVSVCVCLFAHVCMLHAA